MKSCHATSVLESQIHHGLRERKFCAIFPIHPVTTINYTCANKSKTNESQYLKKAMAQKNKHNVLFYMSYFTL